MSPIGIIRRGLSIMVMPRVVILKNMGSNPIGHP